MQGVGRNFLPPPVNRSVLVDGAPLLRAAVGTGTMPGVRALTAALLPLPPFLSVTPEVFQVLCLGRRKSRLLLLIMPVLPVPPPLVLPLLHLLLLLPPVLLLLPPVLLLRNSLLTPPGLLPIFLLTPPPPPGPLRLQPAPPQWSRQASQARRARP